MVLPANMIVAMNSQFETRPCQFAQSLRKGPGNWARRQDRARQDSTPAIHRGGAGAPHFGNESAIFESPPDGASGIIRSHRHEKRRTDPFGREHFENRG